MAGTIADNLDDFTRQSFPDSILTPQGRSWISQPVPDGVPQSDVIKLANNVLPTMTVGHQAAIQQGYVQPNDNGRPLPKGTLAEAGMGMAAAAGWSGANQRVAGFTGQGVQRSLPSLRMRREQPGDWTAPTTPAESAGQIVGQYGTLGAEGMAVGAGAGLLLAPAAAAGGVAGMAAGAGEGFLSGAVPLAAQEGSIGQRTGRFLAGGFGSLLAGGTGKALGKVAGDWVGSLGGGAAAQGMARVTAGQTVGAAIAAGPQAQAEHAISDPMDHVKTQKVTWNEIGRNFFLNLVAGHVFHFAGAAAERAAQSAQPEAPPRSIVEKPQGTLATPMQRLPIDVQEHVNKVAATAMKDAPGSDKFADDKPYSVFGGMTPRQAYNSVHDAMVKRGDPTPETTTATWINKAQTIEDNLQPQKDINTDTAARTAVQTTGALQRIAQSLSTDLRITAPDGTVIESGHLPPDAVRVYPQDQLPIRVTAVDNATGEIHPMAFRSIDELQAALTRPAEVGAGAPGGAVPPPRTEAPRAEEESTANQEGAAVATRRPPLAPQEEEAAAPAGRQRLQGLEFSTKEEAQNVADVVAHQYPKSEPNLTALPGNRWGIHVKADESVLRQTPRPPAEEGKPQGEIPVVGGLRKPSTLSGAARYDELTGRLSVKTNATPEELMDSMKWARDEMRRSRSPMTKQKLKRFIDKLQARYKSLQPGAAKGLSDEMLDRVNASIKAMTRARGKQEQIYRETRGVRIRRSEEIGKRTSGLAGFIAEKRQLAGKMPQVFWTPMEGFSEDEVNTLLDVIKHSPKLDGFQAVRARDALMEMMGRDTKTGAKGVGATLPTDSDLTLLGRVFGDDFVNHVLNAREGQNAAADAVRNLINLPKSLQLMMHFTAPGRQGKFAMTSYPKEWAGAAGEILPSFFSHEHFEMREQERQQDPEYNAAVRYGVSMGELEQEPGRMSAADVSGSAIEKVPVIGDLKKMSDRGYIGNLNQLRFSIWKALRESIRARGLDPEGPSRGWLAGGRRDGHGVGGQRTITDDITDLVNDMTGAGKIPQFMKNGRSVLSSLFSLYGPRLLSGDARMLPDPTGISYLRMDPAIAMEKIRVQASFYGAWAAMMGAVAYMGSRIPHGPKVQMNPMKPNFGGVDWGEHHWNFGQGVAKQMQLIALAGMWAGHIVQNFTRTHPGKNPFGGSKTFADYAERFVWSHMNPTASELWGLAHGKTYTGEPINIESITKDLFVPLVAGDMVDFYSHSDGSIPQKLLSTAIAAPFIATGFAIHSYKQEHKGSGPSFHPRPLTMSNRPYAPKGIPRIR